MNLKVLFTLFISLAAKAVYGGQAVINGVIDLAVQQKALFEDLTTYCQSSSKLILSSEVLLNPHALHRIKNYMNSQGYIVEPLVYVRSPYSYRVSLYQSFLKFSQFSKEEIIKILQRSLVQSAVKDSRDIFGNTVKYFPFDLLGRSGVHVVKHFFSHLLNDERCQELIIKDENKGLSRQAISLLEYIEEKSPRYTNNVANRGRFEGDINLLQKVCGEKFRFDHEQLHYYKQTIEQENTWLRKELGKEFCDENYLEQLAETPLRWGEKEAQSILTVFDKLPIHIQHLVSSYLEEEALYISHDLMKRTVSGIKKELRKNSERWSLSRIKQYFPLESKRGRLARKLYSLMQVRNI